MMKTPIYDFLVEYYNKDITRFHMPGHKGKDFLGIEKYDLTEIKGADDLYHSNGVILESENNATKLFDTEHTFYATNGSTQCIKTMLYLAYINRVHNSNIIISTRNAHKSFINGCAFLDLDVEWVYPKKINTICSCIITAKILEDKIKSMNTLPFAVYLTSPDYLGGIQDIKSLSNICKKYNIPLLVDNAHGSYLKFLQNSLHPIDLGADMCCDSAHKTLSVLTGGAYLHIAKNGKYISLSLDNVKKTLSMFGTSSPSYLILASLDLCNKYMYENYKDELYNVISKVNIIKNKFQSRGVVFENCEPLKIVINSRKIGYTGYEIGEILRKNNIECEFIDDGYVVIMYTENNSEKDFARLEKALNSLQIKKEIKTSQKIIVNKKSISIRKAVFSARETIDVEKSEHKICVNVDLLCPPAIPIIVSGEIIDKNTIKLLKYYDIKTIDVVKEK